MGLKPKAPKALDPTKTAQAQAKYSTQAAQSNVNMNSLDRSGPFAAADFQKDANGNVTGQTSSLAQGLLPGADSTANAFSGLAGNINTTPINWDNTSAQNIANQNYNAYAAMTAPQRQQAQTQLATTLSDRGIPIGSQIYNDAQGNLDRQNAIADTNASAQAWNAVPGMQNQLTANQIAQYNQPTSSAAGSLGLLQGLNGLAPYAPQGTGTTQAPDYSQLAQNQYNAQQQQYQNQMSGLGSLASTGLGLLTAPLTGGAGLSGSLLGKGVSSLFNA